MSLALRVSLTRAGFTLDVDCALPARGVTALFGRSGCGKTTLLRCIAGLERVPDAAIRFESRTWQDARVFEPPHRRAIGYVFQESSLFPHLDVRRNLEFGLRRVAPAERCIRFDDAVSLLELAPLLGQRAAQLSGGQRQRVAIARALLTSPRLLLMDEPLSSLDEESKADIVPRLERLQQQLSIPMIYVSHSLAEVAHLADHLVMLDAGRVLASGPMAELITRPGLPLMSRADAAAVIDAEIAGHDPEYHLSQLRVPGGQLCVSLRALPVGHRVRVRIDARDVSLALEPPRASSIANVLPASVLALIPDRDPAQMLVRIAIGPHPLLARITRRSSVQLDLAPGKALYAQIKSVALME